MRYAVLATGPSMSQAVADAVRGLRVVVVNDAFRLAPWADALVAQDKAWWRENPEALKFSGRKFSTNKVAGVEFVPRPLRPCFNSGALATWVAHEVFGATEILLFGVDLHGSHYFGPHTKDLRNSNEKQFASFRKHFRTVGEMLRAKGVKVINCNPASRLTCFPISPPEAVL